MKCQMSNVKCQNRGFTLIEVLITMSIATIAGGLLLVIIVNSAGIFTEQSAKVTSGLSINDALSKVRSSIKQASLIANSYSDGGITYTTGPNQLVLQVLSVDSLGSVIDSTYDYFVFLLDQTTFRFKIFPNALSSRKPADQVLSNNVDSLIFRYFNSATPPVEVEPTSASKIRVSLTLKQRTGSNFQTNIATSEANLRND